MAAGRIGGQVHPFETKNVPLNNAIRGVANLSAMSEQIIESEARYLPLGAG
jgi:hypothetical protein